MGVGCGCVCKHGVGGLVWFRPALDLRLAGYPVGGSGGSCGWGALRGFVRGLVQAWRVWQIGVVGRPEEQQAVGRCSSACPVAVTSCQPRMQPILDDPESFDPLAGVGEAPPSAGAGGAGEPATRNRGAGTGAARRGRRRKAASSDDETESEDEEMGEAEEEEAEDQGSAHGSAAAGGGVPPGFAQQAGLASLLPGSYFLPLGSGLQQQLGVSLSLAPGASMQSMPAFHPGAAAGAGAGPRLPAIRTRAAQQRQQLGASGGGMGAAGMDLSEVLSPLAASLLSPLGLAGSPSGAQREGTLCAGPSGSPARAPAAALPRSASHH